jgi:translation initiation factor IF-3
LTLAEALEKARNEGQDLVEVAPNARPPVARILNYKKYQYQKAREGKKSAKKSRGGETKELRFGPNISANDLKTKLTRAKEFLEQGNKVKLTVHFKGRQITHPEIGREKMTAALKALENHGEVEQEPRRDGYFLYTLLKPR